MCYGYSIKIDARLDAAQVLTRSGARRAEVCTEHDEARIDAGNRSSSDAVETTQALMLDALDTPAPVRASEPLATAKQVAYIESLLADGRVCWMSGPRDREGIARMTRRDASEYITALKEG